MSRARPLLEAEGLSTTLHPPPGLAARVAEPFRLADVSFAVRPGERVALLGPNGSGKTTLLRLLGGVFRARSGCVALRGRTSPVIGLVSLFEDELTVGEHLESFRDLAPVDVADALDFAGLRSVVDRPVRWLSSGERVRLALAPALLVDADVYLVDEGLAVCDPRFRRRALERLRSRAREGACVLLAGQHLLAARALCERGLVLEGGRLVFDGGMEGAAERLLGGTPDGTVTIEAVQVFGEEGRAEGGEQRAPRLLCRIRGAESGHVLMTALRDDDGRVVATRRTPVGVPAEGAGPGESVSVSVDLGPGDEGEDAVPPGRYAVSAAVTDAEGVALVTRNDAVVVRVGGSGQA